MYKIVIYAPVMHSDQIRQALGEAGAGKLGEYEYCSFSCRGVGRFRPLNGAKPFIGKIGEIEAVEEERIETICPEERIQEVLAKVKAAHPYDEPAIEAYPLIYPN